MFGMFGKQAPNIEHILFSAAQALEADVLEYVDGSSSEIAYSVYGVQTNYGEVGLFTASVVASIGMIHARGTETTKQTAITNFINKYLGTVAERLGKSLVEVSMPYLEREKIYRALLDRAFAYRDPLAPAQFAKTLYAYVFCPKYQPGDAIGPALLGHIYTITIEAKKQLQV